MLTENQVIQLRDSLNNEGYCQVNNIFHSQLVDYFRIGSLMLEFEATQESDNEDIKTKDKKSLYKYATTMGENLLIYLTPIYSQISNKNLIPTYSFYRKYFYSNTLEKHKDRPSCQYSATVQIDSSENKSWPIWIETKKNKNVKCNTSLGDIVFYKGEEVLHWREELNYEYSSHLFLHWVDKDDPKYKDYHLDGRGFLGDPLIPK